MSHRKRSCGCGGFGLDFLSDNYTILALILIVLQFSRPFYPRNIAPVVDGADGVGCGGPIAPFAGGLDNNLLFLIVFLLLTKCGCKGLGMNRCC